MNIYFCFNYVFIFISILCCFFLMDFHAFRVDDCPHNLHEVDGRHLAALHQLIRGSVFRWHRDIQQELGRSPTPYTACPPNPTKTQFLCQFGEMNFWYDPCSIYGVHHWWVGCACGPGQDKIYLILDSPNHSNRATHLSNTFQFLP